MAFAAVFGGWLLLSAAVLAVSAWCGIRPTVKWGALVALLTYEPAVGAVLLAFGRRRPVVAGKLPSLSVLMAAFNERASVVASVRSVLSRCTPETEVVVGDDGSTDGMSEALIEAFALRPCTGSVGDEQEWHGRGASARLRLVRLPHRGKGATLNSLVARARHEVVVTVDADTELAPEALARIARPFCDPRVGSAAGAVVLRNGDSNLLTRFQYNEYLRNTAVRWGWSGLGGLDQVPGAFGAIRRRWLVEAGGFATDSLTEDYAVTFALQADAARRGRALEVATVADAVAFTDGPTQLRGLVRQRTRWFTGFLTTLWAYRRLVARPGTGAFGAVRLPLKIVDAALPLLSWVALVTVCISSARHFRLALPALSTAFLLRAAWDGFFYGVVVRRTLAIDVLRSPAARALWWATPLALLDGVSYAWLRQLIVLRAYWWALRGRAAWESSR